MKVLITHEGQQSVFKRISAMKNNGIDVYYATSFYHRRTLPNRMFEKLLSNSERNRLRGRRCQNIDDDHVYVYSKLLGLNFICINRMDKSRVYRDKILKLLVNSFSKKVIKLLKKEKFDMVIVLGESADNIAAMIANERIIIPVVKDTTSANAEFCNKIYANDVNKSGVFGRDMNNIFLSKIVKNEHENKKQNYYRIITSSHFVANSYQDCIKKENAVIVTYGMDVSNFTEKTNQPTLNSKLKVLYVGNIDERKGIFYINELAKQCTEIAVFSVIGDASLSNEAISELKANVSISGRVSHSELPDIYKQHDVFVFPSLSDSFGNVVAEAMASGLPVICSKNAGVSDLIVNGVNGFIVNYDDVSNMKTILQDLYNNPEKISTIGHKARQTAMENDPKHYEDVYSKTIFEIMRSWSAKKIENE